MPPMHDGLDLSRFSKVSSDKKTTVLRHRNGHELKIASSALTPKMREHIDALPAHDETGVKRYAEGSKKPVSNDDQTAPSPQDTQAIDAQSPAPPVAQNETPEPAPQPNSEATLAPTPSPTQQAPAAPQPAATLEAAPVESAPAPPPKPTPQQVAQNKDKEAMAFQADLTQGHIQPKTYQELFNDKGTLGKIGTLFGLLVSGAGSGLTHQPNAVMEMMDKEIQRDLEAQKQSAANKETWYSTGLKHQMNQAQIEQMGVQNLNTLSQAGLAQAQTGKIPAETARLEAETQGLKATAAKTGVETQLEKLKLGIAQGLSGPADGGAPGQNSPVATINATADAETNMKLAALHNQQTIIDKWPAGPQKEAAQNLLNQLNTMTMQGISQKNLQTANKVATVEALGQQAKPAGEDVGYDQNLLNELDRKVQQGELTGFPVSYKGKPINRQQLTEAQEQANVVGRNRAVYKMWEKSFDRLSKLSLGGKLNPGMRDAEVELIAPEVLKMMGSGHSIEEAKAKASAMFPDWKDMQDKKIREAKRENMRDQFMATESSLGTAKRLGLITPFPGGAIAKKSGKGASGGWGNKETASEPTGGKKKYPEGHAENGWVVKGGKWVPNPTSAQAKK